MDLEIRPGAELKGSITPPPDKSISHRALLLNAIAGGHARIENLLSSDDVASTIDCLEKLGVLFHRSESWIEIRSEDLRDPPSPWVAGISGTP
jgi:3-phosphoshikimate 1-carboxyvinyltransferase